MSAKSALLLLLFWGAAAFPQSFVDQRVAEGAEALFNFDFTRAEQIFDKAVKSNPDDPAGYYYKAQVSLWNYLGNGSSKDLESFTRSSDIAIEKSSALQGNRQSEEYAGIFLGNIFTQRVIAYGKAEKYLDMIWASQKAHSYLTDVNKQNPNNYEAYLGLGLFKFFLAQVPSTFRWALNLIGYSGNVREGVNYLRLASQKAVFTRVESQFYYAQILSDYLQDYPAAEKLLRNLQQKYPDNLMIGYSLAIVHIKAHDLKSAGGALKKIIAARSNRFPQIKSYTNFLLGEVFYKQNQFEKAESYFKTFLETTSDKNYTGSANLRLAVCAFAGGKHPEAKNRLESAKAGNPAIDDDHYARKTALYLQKFSFTQDFLDLVRFSNYIEAGEYRRASDSLMVLLPKLREQGIRAEAQYYISYANFRAGDYRKADEYAKNAIAAAAPAGRKWLIPFSCLVLAESAFRQGNPESAKNHLKTGESYSDFEYASKFKMWAISLKTRQNLL